MTSLRFKYKLPLCIFIYTLLIYVYFPYSWCYEEVAAIQIISFFAVKLLLGQNIPYKAFTVPYIGGGIKGYNRWL